MGLNYPRVSVFVVSPVPSPLNHGSKLVTLDGKKTEIARFHRASCFRKKKARLEIQPAGMDMLDQIILTFVFVEDKRRARERAARSGG